MNNWLQKFYKKSALQEEIESLENSLIHIMDHERYMQVVEQLKALKGLKEKKPFIAPEAVLTAVVSITCTLLVLNFEKEDTIISKAFNKRW